MYATIRWCWYALCLSLIIPVVQAQEDSDTCHVKPGQWVLPDSGRMISSGELFERIGGKRVILLGEMHDQADHHHWQAYVSSVLHGMHPDLHMGFEMLPGSADPTLAEWGAGALSRADFLEQVEWGRVWGMDPDLYMPLFNLVRIHRIPAFGMNVPRKQISRVAELGWEAAQAEDPMAVSKPAPASSGYVEQLAQLFAYKRQMQQAHKEPGEDDNTVDIDEIKASDTFRNFVQAQTTWDRAMAESIARVYRANPYALIVGVVGRGHLEHGYGIPHQLKDLGIDGVTVLLPENAGSVCEDLAENIADIVFVVEESALQAVAPRPRLGVVIETVDKGVRVLEVAEGSVAESSGMLAQDVIIRAAGFEVIKVEDLVSIIQRQAPGTWLPLEFLRNNKHHEIVARFPQSFDAPK